MMLLLLLDDSMMMLLRLMLKLRRRHRGRQTDDVGRFLQDGDGFVVRHVLQRLAVDGQQPVAHPQSSVYVRRSFVDDLRDEDAVVAGNVLIAATAGDRKAQAFVAFAQFDVKNGRSIDEGTSLRSF